MTVLWRTQHGVVEAERLSFGLIVICPRVRFQCAYLFGIAGVALYAVMVLLTSVIPEGLYIYSAQDQLEHVEQTSPQAGRPEVEGLFLEWQRVIEDGVDQLMAKLPPGPIRIEKAEVQFLDGNIYVPNDLNVAPWEKARLWNFFGLLKMAYNKFGNIPNLDMMMIATDCPCMKRHCFAAITCDVDHPNHRHVNFPYVQWLFDRDQGFDKLDDNLRSNIEYARGSPWEGKLSAAVYRGAINSRTMVRGLPGDALYLDLTADNWKNYGRGRLISLRQEPGAEKYLNISVSSGHWMNMGSHIPWEEITKGLVMDEPPYFGMHDQARNYKMVIHAEGHCGWADRLKWLLSLGLVPLLQETRCREWYGMMLRPWVHYIPVDGLFNNLTAAVQWGQANDDKLRRMSENCMEFASNVTGSTGTLYYIHYLMTSYAARLDEAHRPKQPDPSLVLWDAST